MPLLCKFLLTSFLGVGTKNRWSPFDHKSKEQKKKKDLRINALSFPFQSVKGSIAMISSFFFFLRKSIARKSLSCITNTWGRINYDFLVPKRNIKKKLTLGRWYKDNILLFYLLLQKRNGFPKNGGNNLICSYSHISNAVQIFDHEIVDSWS